MNDPDESKFAHLIKHKIQHGKWSELELHKFLDAVDKHDKKRLFYIAKQIINELYKARVPNPIGLLSIVEAQLSELTPTYLTKLANVCLEHLTAQDNVTLCWKNLLPGILNVLVLVHFDSFTYDGNEITGNDFRAQMIQQLIMIKWTPAILSSIIGMCLDIQLTNEEHMQITRKLSLCLPKMTVSEVPPFVHHMLKFCNKNHSEIFFPHLQNYYHQRLYVTMNEQLHSTGSQMEEIEPISHDDIFESESTVFYHIYHALSMGDKSVKNYLNHLQMVCKSPEYILHPFQFNLLLAMVCARTDKATCLDILKCSVARDYQEQRKRESAWFREMVKCSVNFEDVLRYLLGKRTTGKELIYQGVITFAFSLLTANSFLNANFSRDPLVEKQWYYAQFILVKLMKRNESYAVDILTRLKERLLMGQHVGQYIECLYQLCRVVRYTVLNNQQIIISIVQQLDRLPKDETVTFIKSIMPIIQISNILRDNAICYLRKKLYSANPDERKTAACSFLEILKHLKVKSFQALSQSQQSNACSEYSVLTQISAEVHGGPQTNMGKSPTNDMVCLEIISVLQRCFSLQYELKLEFYDGIYETIVANPELKSYLIDFLLRHFKQYYRNEEEILPPIYFSKIVNAKGQTPELSEPIGKLLYVIGSIVSDETVENEEPSVVRSRQTLRTMLESLVTRMGKCDALHFEMDENILASSDGPAKMLQLEQIITVYEALMGYVMLAWNKDTQTSAKQFLGLFKAYGHVMDFVKSLKKIKKPLASKKRTKSVDEPSTLADATVTKETATKSTFTKPTTVLTFPVIKKAFEILLTDDIDWNANVIKTKRDIHQFVLTTAVDFLQTIKAKRSFEFVHRKVYFQHLCEIARIIYERCLKRFDEYLDFCVDSAILSLELFHVVVTIIAMNYTNADKILEFFNSAHPSELPRSYDQIAYFDETFKKIITKPNDRVESEAMFDKIGNTAIKILMQLVAMLPIESSYSKQLLDWCKKYVEERPKDANGTTSAAFINLIAHLQIRAVVNIPNRCNSPDSVFDNMVARIAKVMGSISENEIECTMNLSLINEESMMSALQTVCNVLKTQLSDVNWVITRLRADATIIPCLDEETAEAKREKLKSHEFDVCAYLCQIMEVLTTVCDIAVPTFVSNDCVVKLITQLYSTLTAVTKHFINRCSKTAFLFQNARFENVIKTAEGQLSANLYAMILFTTDEHQSTQPVEPSAKKRKTTNTAKTKILRNSKFIPKLIYEKEQFHKAVIKLSNKTKVDLTKHAQLGTARDFRIKLPDVKK